MPVWVMLCTSCTLAFSSLQQDIPHWCHIRAVVRICSHKSCVSLTVDADQDIGCSAARCDAVPRIIPTPQPPHALKQRCTSELNVAAFHLLLCIVLDNLFQRKAMWQSVWCLEAVQYQTASTYVQHAAYAYTGCV